MIDRRDRNARKQIGEQAHHHVAIFEHIRHTRRGAQIVFEHIERVVPDLDQVNARDMDVDVVRYGNAAHFGAEQVIAEYLLRWDNSGLDDFLTVVDVLEKRIERAHPLAAAVGQFFPCPRPQDARNDVKRN